MDDGRSLRFAIFVGAAIGFQAAPAGAASAGTNVLYLASAGCPNESEFQRELALHRRDPSAFPERPILIEVAALEGSAKASVRFVDEGGFATVRELTATTCTEVTAAAALVVALAIDAQRTADSSPTPPLPPPAPILTVAPVAPQPPMDDGTASVGAAERSFQVGAGALAHSAMAPVPVLGFTGFIGIGGRSPRWSLRANFVYAKSGRIDEGDQAATFTLIAGRADGCVATIFLTARLSLDPCAAIELGAVRTAGIETPRFTATQETTFWGAAGPLLRLQASFSELGLEVYGGPWVPFPAHRTFAFQAAQPETAFHHVALVGWIAGANISASFN